MKIINPTTMNTVSLWWCIFAHGCGCIVKGKNAIVTVYHIRHGNKWNCNKFNTAEYRQVSMGAPALSREDNETLICPDCGTREALESIGVDSTEQEKILDTIHRCMDGQ